MKRGDPFVAHKYEKYLQLKKKGKELLKKENFYKRMEKDLDKRKVSTALA